MVHDTNASDTAPDPDSPGDDDISYSDWQSPAGAVIEARIDTKIWPDALVNSFQQTAPKIFDEILAMHDSAPASVSLCLCDDLQMQQINRQHRQIDKATNVLSFPGETEMSFPGAEVLLGDIILAWQTVTKEAQRDDKPVADHMMHLVIHGVLHLLGYDHECEEDAAVMEQLEVNCMASLGLSDPYTTGD